MIKANLACLLSALVLVACTPPAAPPAEPEAAPVAPPVASISSSCPNLTITATAATPPARDVTVTASIENPPAGIMYNWTVSAGAITSGQGTASISVDPPVGEPVTAMLEVGGGSEPCYGSATIEVP